MQTAITKKIVGPQMFPEPHLIEQVIASARRENKIFIPGEVPSKKNSQQILFNPQTKRHFISVNALVAKYERQSKIFYNQNREIFKLQSQGKPYPLEVEFTYQRRTKQPFDFNNLSQMVQDMMVSCGWIEDDNFNFLIPATPKVVFNKELYGVWIKVL